MLRWPNNQGVMGDDPPYLSVGTEVSAKYKGAFCEAKVRKVVRSVKCKVNFKLGLGTAIVTDDQIRGVVRVGSAVEVKHPDKKEYVEASITKIQDCSQYTVVFDDGDITTLRRTALCLKSGRHFAESETLDQLPLTHPEHFGNPVVGSRRGGRRSRNPMSDESSDEDDEPPKGKSKEEKEADIGKVVCVELGDKKKLKDNWFPGLIVAPTAQEVVRIRVKDEYLVRSFKDGRYFTVPKKEATEFTREIGAKVDNNTLKTAVDKALLYLDKDELPAHWDREVLFGFDDASTASDSDAAFESDSSDDEPREEKDHFVAQLYKFMDDRGTPINRGPVISGRDIDLYKLFKVVHKLGGCNRVTNHNQWKLVSHKLGFGQFIGTANHVKVAYKKYLHSFEDFYRKLGCTMVNHPRGNRVRHRGGRSLIRDKDRATPVNIPKGDCKDKSSDNPEDEEDQPAKREETVESVEEKEEEKDDEVSKKKESKSKEKEDVVSGVKRLDKCEVIENRKIEEKDEKNQRLSNEATKADNPSPKNEPPAPLIAAKDVESSVKLTVDPPALERKPSDSQLKFVSPKVKPVKKSSEGSGSKSNADAKKRVPGAKVKGGKDEGNEADDGDDGMEELDVEEVEEEDDKLTTTRSKSKEEGGKPKESRVTVETDRKSRVENSDRKIKPSLTATIEKRVGRPTPPVVSEKKARASSQDSEKKSVRSLAAEFEKKSRGPDADKKERDGVEGEKKSRSLPHGESERRIKPSPLAVLERKKSSHTEGDKKGKQGDNEKKGRQSGESERKVRPSLTADPERKKVRPSLTADPTKKVSRHDSEKRKDSEKKNVRPADADRDDSDRKSKPHDADRKVNSNEKPSAGGDSEKKSSKSDAADSERKSNPKSKKVDDEKKKLHIRRKKDCDDGGGASADDGLDLLPNYKNVCVGDKLKVYYGPTHESKVTYEAKVLEVEGDGQDEAFLVHYTGWNNRYDEWIKRSRIADNLSWSPARGKRRHQAVVAGIKKSCAKRRTLTPVRDSSSPQQKEQAPTFPPLLLSEKSRDSQPPRSSTPSSVTSSSSRTKSPATRPGSARVTRNTVGETTQTVRRTRTRRISGQTDVPSESESEASESGSEADPSQPRKSSRRTTSEREEEGMKKESVSRRKGKKKEAEIELDEFEDKEVVKDESKDFINDDDCDASSESPSEDKAQIKRTRKTGHPVSDRKPERKADVDEESSGGSQITKGRDFDLNQIRLELKGIDKTMPVSSPLCEEKEDKIELAAATLEQPITDVDESIIDMEDVYEFKEPEPFEFEVRSKRESSVESTGKLQKRPPPRIFEDLEMPEKPLVSRKEMNPKSDSSEDCGSPERKRFRLISDKEEEEEEEEEDEEDEEEEDEDEEEEEEEEEEDESEDHRDAPELVPEKDLTVEPVGLQKKSFSSASEEVFEKMKLSPSYRFPSSPITVDTPSPRSPPCAPTPVLSPQVAGAAPVCIRPSAPPVLTPRSIPPLLAIAKLCPDSSPLLHTISARPPTLESVKATNVEEWQVNRQTGTGKMALERSASSLDLVKVEESPAQSMTSADRTSPEPPQLLPMLCPTPTFIEESPKMELKDVPMPEIKKETFIGTSPPSPYLSEEETTQLPELLIKEEPIELVPEEIDPPLKRVVRRKTPMKRKKAVSKEFVDDSDSSDEESRLVIDKSDSSDLSDDSADDTIPDDEPGRQNSSKTLDPITDQFEPYSIKNDDLTSYSQSKEASLISCDDSMCFDESTIKSEEPEEQEVDSNLCSLLCEETIPGSPTPANDQSADINADNNSSCSSERASESTTSSSCKLLEMPFASVPGNSRSPRPSSTSSAGTLQYPKMTAAHLNENSGSPGAELVLGKPGSSSNEATPAIDNTPPTTPDSCMSIISNSPRGGRGDSPSGLDIDSCKSHRDSEDVDNKDIDFSDDDIEISNGSKRLHTPGKRDGERDEGRDIAEEATMSPMSSKKRRRSRKSSDSEDRVKRPRHSGHRLSAPVEAGSDSDDNVENIAPVNSSPSPQPQPQSSQTQGTHHSAAPSSRSPRPSKYNFIVVFAPEMDATQRIALLMQKVQELRKSYASVKQQLAIIDRRRKKLRRREREEKAAKQELSCS